MYKVAFKAKEKTEFFATVRKKVDNHFKKNKLSKYANREMYVKSIIFQGGFLLIYLLIVLNVFTSWKLLVLASLLGCFKVLVGFNVCHDALHGAYSSKKSINKALGLTFNLLGANNYLWGITHNLAHHNFTNIYGHDEDIEIAPGLIRVSPMEKYRPIMKLQHYYAFPLYGLALIIWVFKKDFVKIFRSKFGEMSFKHPKNELIRFFFFKFLYVLIYIAIPLYVLPISLGEFLLGFFIMHYTAGLMLAFVFQLAHIVEGNEFPELDEEGTAHDAWAVHQLRTTANFSMDNKLTNFLLGGLNMQIEHHLFPKICHVHYASISKIIRETAEEFNLPYNVYPSFFSALKSHYKMLKKMSHNRPFPA